VPYPSGWLVLSNLARPRPFATLRGLFPTLNRTHNTPPPTSLEGLFKSFCSLLDDKLNFLPRTWHFGHIGRCKAAAVIQNISGRPKDLFVLIWQVERTGEPVRQAQREGKQMRAGIGIAVVVAIGLIWSVAVMSKLVPVDGSEMGSAATSPHVGDQALLIR
jgi:hypothetical protein